MNPALKIFAQQLLTAKARPVTAGYGELDTDFSNQLALMLAGKVSVDARAEYSGPRSQQGARLRELSKETDLGQRPATLSPDAASRRSARPHRVRRTATPYLLLAPAIVMYAVFTVYPIYRQFDISFFNWHIFPGASNPFVGWSNYTAIFTDPVVRTASFNSFLFIVITVPVQMAIGLFAAAVLTDRLPGSMFWRAAVYIPVVTSWVVVSWVFSYIFASQGGVMNAVGRFLRRPHGEHRLDRTDLDGERGHLASEHLEGCRLVFHHLPRRS